MSDTPPKPQAILPSSNEWIKINWLLPGRQMAWKNLADQAKLKADREFGAYIRSGRRKQVVAVFERRRKHVVANFFWIYTKNFIFFICVIQLINPIRGMNIRILDVIPN